MAIVKQDPAPSRLYAGKVDWSKAVKLARADKGSWFLCGEFSPGMAQHLRKGSNKAFFADGDPKDPERYMRQNWEIAARVVRRGEQRVHIYIRFVGKP